MQSGIAAFRPKRLSDGYVSERLSCRIHAKGGSAQPLDSETWCSSEAGVFSTPAATHASRAKHK
jgi:hypothetical protein